MTRKNKLLSIVFVAVMFVACVFGFAFTNKTAKAAVELPNVDSSSIEGALYTANGGEPYIGTKKSTTADWVIFEWTNLEPVAFHSGWNAGYMYIGQKRGGSQHGVQADQAKLAPSLWDIYNKNSAETVKLFVGTKTGDVYVAKNGGAAKFVATISVDNPDNLPVYVNFCNHHIECKECTRNARVDNLKIYDSNGKNLMVSTSFTPHIDPPVVENVKAQAMDVEFSGSNYAFYTEDYIYGEKLIFEWTNGNITPRLTGFAGGYRATYILADKNNEAALTGPDGQGRVKKVAALHNLQNAMSNRVFYTSNATIKLVFDMKNGGLPMAYIMEEGQTEFTLMSINYATNEFDAFENADNGEYKLSIWFNGVIENGTKHNFNDLKCYDENGNAYGLKLFNGKYTAKTVSFMDGADGKTLHKEYKNAQPGRSFAQFEDLVAPTTANFVGWTKTLDGVDFVNKTAPVPAEGGAVYAKYANEEKSDISSYVGIYESAKNYFEINADGTITSYNNVIPNGELRVFTDEAYTYANLAGAIGLVDGNTFTIDGVSYTKTTNVVKVKYYVEGEIHSELSLPVGKKAPDKKVQILAKTFNGWRAVEAGNAKFYDFNKAITADINFIADININYAEESTYQTFNYSYYNKEENTIYVMRPDKTYTCLTIGEDPVEGTYKIVTEGTATYAVFDDDQNVAKNPIFLDKVSLQLDKNYTKLDPDGYEVLVVLNNGTEDKTFTVDARSNYLLNLGRNTPSKKGYTLKGYELGDGTAYDMNTIVTGAMTLYAVWEPDGTIAPIETNDGLGIVSIVLIIVAGVALVAGGAYVVLALKNKPASAELADDLDEGADNE